MADGLVKFGSKRILPPPTPSVMAAMGLSGGGGDPGGGFMEPSVALSGILLPNGAGNVGYEGMESSADIPITAREFTGSDSAITSGAEDTISVDDANYIEVSNSFFPVAAGHRVEYDLSAYTPVHFRSVAAGYGWEDDTPSYQFGQGCWNYTGSEYDDFRSHTAEEKNGLTFTFFDMTAYISGGDVVSQLMEGKPWGNGSGATTYTRTYFASIEVYE